MGTLEVYARKPWGAWEGAGAGRRQGRRRRRWWCVVTIWQVHRPQGRVSRAYRAEHLGHRAQGVPGGSGGAGGGLQCQDSGVGRDIGVCGVLRARSCTLFYSSAVAGMRAGPFLTVGRQAGRGHR